VLSLEFSRAEVTLKLMGFGYVVFLSKRILFALSVVIARVIVCHPPIAMMMLFSLFSMMLQSHKFLLVPSSLIMLKIYYMTNMVVILRLFLIVCFQRDCVLSNPSLPSSVLGFSRALKEALDKVIFKPNDISCWVSLLVLPLCLLKTFSLRSNLECNLQLVRKTLVESSSAMLDVDGEHLELGERNIKQCKRKICDGYYTTVVRVLSSYDVAPYCDATLEDLKTKHPFKHAPSLPSTSIDNHHLIASPTMVLDKIKSFPRGTSYGRDGLRAQHIMDSLSRAIVAISDDAPLTPMVKPGGGIHPIAVGTIWRRLVSKVGAVMIGNSLDGYLDCLQFGVGVSKGGEARLHAVNRLIEGRVDDVGHSMLLDDGTIVGDTLVVGRLRKTLEAGLKVFSPNISRPLHGVNLLGGPASVDFGFSSELVMKRVAKTIRLMDAIAKTNDPKCELLLLRACTGICKLYFAMCTCPPRIFESAQRSFDVALRSALERIATAYGPGFGD
ncbi:hypothetical protein Tco_0246825, partial [Tanacetum coccineum]